jgi:hypothetical protein
MYYLVMSIVLYLNQDFTLFSFRRRRATLDFRADIETFEPGNCLRQVSALDAERYNRIYLRMALQVESSSSLNG